MRRAYFDTRGVDEATASKRLASSLCPAGADVRLDPATGICSVTTDGPWRPEALKSGRVVETGIGVAGWGLISVEEVDDAAAPYAVIDPVVEAKLALSVAAPLDVAALAAADAVADVGPAVKPPG